MCACACVCVRACVCVCVCARACVWQEYTRLEKKDIEIACHDHKCKVSERIVCALHELYYIYIYVYYTLSRGVTKGAREAGEWPAVCLASNPRIDPTAEPRHPTADPAPGGSADSGAVRPRADGRGPDPAPRMSGFRTRIQATVSRDGAAPTALASAGSKGCCGGAAPGYL